MDFNLTPQEEWARLIVKMREKFPFFAYLVHNFRVVWTDSIPTAAVDGKGTLYLNPEFIHGLGDTIYTRTEMFMGVAVHEVLHIVYKHLERAKSRSIVIEDDHEAHHELFNIATDIVINNTIVMNDMKLPEGVIIPNDNSYTIFDVQIDDISDKTAEEIYSLLAKELKEKEKDKGDEDGDGSGDQEGDSDGSGKSKSGDGGTVIKTGKKVPKGSDHSKWGEQSSDDDKSSEDGDGSDKAGEISKKDIDWDQVLANAHVYSKQRGMEPIGLGREFDDLHKSKIPWQRILRKEIAKAVPYDMTYNRPNRNYMGREIYMPSTYGESIEVLCSVDTSGSMSQKDLTDVVSELMGIANEFKNQVKFRILTHDIDVHDDIEIKNSAKQKLKSIKLSGGGGTSHRPLYDYIVNKRYHKKTKLLISFTDGFSDYPDKRMVPTLFILGGYHCGKDALPKWSKAIELPEDN